MTILQSIQEAHAAAGLPPTSLAFAPLREFNEFKDVNYYDAVALPINVVVPVTINGVITEPYRIKDTAVIQGWMLTRLTEDTNNYRSMQIEPSVINPMRVFAKKFIVALLNTDVVDPEAKDVSYTIMPEYAFLDAHFFGVSYRVNLPVHDRVC